MESNDYVLGEYDVVVIGAGHAGCEAALASARLGKKTAAFVINLDTLANMPCNPSIGGREQWKIKIIWMFIKLKLLRL